jgi:hypothetical protein
VLGQPPQVSVVVVVVLGCVVEMRQLASGVSS